MKLIKTKVTVTTFGLELKLNQGLPTENGIYAVWGISGRGPAMMEVYNGQWRTLTNTDYACDRINSHDLRLQPLEGAEFMSDNWCEEWY